VNETVRGLVLLASVALWLPFLRPLLDGDLTVVQGLGRYGCALLLAWAAGSGLTALVRGYSAQTGQRAAGQPEPTRTSPSRRAGDRPVPEPLPAAD